MKQSFICILTVAATVCSYFDSSKHFPRTEENPDIPVDGITRTAHSNDWSDNKGLNLTLTMVDQGNKIIPDTATVIVASSLLGLAAEVTHQLDEFRTSPVLLGNTGYYSIGTNRVLIVSASIC